MIILHHESYKEFLMLARAYANEDTTDHKPKRCAQSAHNFTPSLLKLNSVCTDHISVIKLLFNRNHIQSKSKMNNAIDETKETI